MMATSTSDCVLQVWGGSRGESASASASAWVSASQSRRMEPPSLDKRLPAHSTPIKRRSQVYLVNACRFVFANGDVIA